MRKFLLLLVLLGLTGTARSQSNPPPQDSVRQFLDNVFANVDASQVPTPYLEDYGFRFAPLRLFNGALQDSNRTTATVWRLLYGSVLSGNINGPSPLPLLPDLNTV